MMRQSLLLALFALLCCIYTVLPSRAQDSNLLSLLESRNKQLHAAIIHGDLAPVHDVFASSAAIINPVGGVVSPEEFAALVKSGTLKYTSIETSEARLMKMGNVALLIVMSTDSGTMQGHDITGKYRRTEVWSKESGQWKIVAVQSTPVVAGP